MIRSSRGWRRAALFAGLRLDAEDATFSSPHGRRVVQLAHQMHNMQRLPQLSMAQSKYDKRHHTRKFNIVCHAKPSQRGFTSFYKAAPLDFVIRENGVVPGKVDAAASTALLEQRPQAPGALWKNVRRRLLGTTSRRQEMVATPSHGSDSIVATRSTSDVAVVGEAVGNEQHAAVGAAVEALFLKLLSLVAVEPSQPPPSQRQRCPPMSKRWASRRLRDVASLGHALEVHGTTKNSILLDHVSPQALQVWLEVLFVCFALSTPEHAPQPSSPQGSSYGSSSVDRSTSDMEGRRRLLRSMLLEEGKRIQVHVEGLVPPDAGRAHRAGSGSSSSVMPTASALTIHVTAAQDAQLALLLRTLGGPLRASPAADRGSAARAVLMFVVQCALWANPILHRHTCYGDAVVPEAELLHGIHVPWPNATSLAKTLFVSGATAVDKSEYGNRRHRVGIAGTTKAQAMQAMLAVDCFAQRWMAPHRCAGGGGGGGGGASVVVHGNRLHLHAHLSIKPPGGTEKTNNALSVVVPASASVDASGAADTGVAQQDGSLFLVHCVQFQVVEFVLEKVGLSHTFVVQDLLDELRNSAATTVSAYDAELVLSHRGILDGRSQTFQVCRVRGSSLRAVEHLADRLRRGVVLGSRDHRTAVCPDTLGSTSGMGLGGNRGHLTLDWRDKASDPEPQRARSRGRGGAEDANEATAAEEAACWREHYYLLHDARVVWEAVVSDDGDDDGLSASLHAALPGGEASGHPTAAMLPTAAASQHTRLSKVEEGGTSALAVATDTAVIAAARPGGGDWDAPPSPSTGNPLGRAARKRRFLRRCRRVEAISATYDLRIGQGVAHYAYDIAVRRIPYDEARHVVPAVQSVATRGFVNYFGPQRFDVSAARGTHPGLHLLKGEFQAAAYLMVDDVSAPGFPMDRDGGATAAPPSFKDQRQSDDAQRDNALRRVLRQALAVHSGLSASLSHSGGTSGTTGSSDGVVAVASNETCADVFLHVVGRPVVKTLVHEFLAFVWNDIATQRIKRFGPHCVLEGDLVWKEAVPSEGVDSSCDGASTLPVMPMPGVLEQGAAATQPKPQQRFVGFVTQDDLAQQRYSPFDVLLPIPGLHVAQPRNGTAEIVQGVLRHYGIAFDDMVQTWPLFAGPRDAAMRRPYGGSAYTQGERGRVDTIQIVVEEDEVEGNDNKLVDAVACDGQGDALRSDGRDAFSVAHSSSTGAGTGNALGITFRGGYRPLLWQPSIASTTLAQDVAAIDATEPLGYHRLFASSCSGYDSAPQHHHHRRPYWLPRAGPSVLHMHVSLPPGVYPSMLLRELTKLDVNFPEEVDLVGEAARDDAKARSWHALKAHDKATYQNLMNKKRRHHIAVAPASLHRALLYQRIFKSDGMRRSLIPSNRRRDDVSK